MVKIIQHFCSGLGLVIIAYTFYKLPVNKDISGLFNVRYWGTLALTTVIFIGFQLLNGLSYRQFGSFVVTVISATLISLIITPWVANGFKKINW
jgi:hypothetical protein